jgi:hypothetical protein
MTSKSSTTTAFRPSLNKLTRKDFYAFQEEDVPNGLDSPKANHIPDVLEFIFKPPSVGKTTKCRISLANGLVCNYTLCVETDDGNIIPVLTSRKGKFSLMPAFLIDTYGPDGENVAVLEKNMLASIFSLYEIRKITKISADFSTNASKNQQKSQSRTTIDRPKAMMYVEYETFVSNVGVPTKMSVYLPGLGDERNSNYEYFYNRDVLIAKKDLQDNTTTPVIGSSLAVEDGSLNETQKRRYLNGGGNVNLFYGPVVGLTTKQPTLDRITNVFKLNMNGRANLGSVANFQLIHETNPHYVVMQCGKLERDIFSCDFSYPMNALQAFCVALSCLYKNE